MGKQLKPRSSTRVYTLSFHISPSQRSIDPHQLNRLLILFEMFPPGLGKTLSTFSLSDMNQGIPIRHGQSDENSLSRTRMNKISSTFTISNGVRGHRFHESDNNRVRKKVSSAALSISDRFVGRNQGKGKNDEHGIRNKISTTFSPSNPLRKKFSRMFSMSDQCEPSSPPPTAKDACRRVGGPLRRLAIPTWFENNSSHPAMSLPMASDGSEDGLGIGKRLGGRLGQSGIWNWRR